MAAEVSYGDARMVSEEWIHVMPVVNELTAPGRSGLAQRLSRTFPSVADWLTHGCLLRWEQLG